jgi:hypothetical protein
VVLPVRVDVYWDDQGVSDAEQLVRMSRWLTARGLGEAMAHIVAEELPVLAPFMGSLRAQDIRRGLSTYTSEPPPAVPVQLEVAVVVLFGGHTAPELRDHLRLRVAMRLVNWCESQIPGTFDNGHVRAIRLSLWMEPEVLQFELDPVRGVLLGGEGGDIQSYTPGHRIPRS